MKKLITLICIIALMAVPVIGNAAPAEKTISVKAYKPGQESTLSMANKSLNPEAKVVEKSEGKYISSWAANVTAAGLTLARPSRAWTLENRSHPLSYSLIR